MITISLLNFLFIARLPVIFCIVKCAVIILQNDIYAHVQVRGHSYQKFVKMLKATHPL